jgi:hypothetical protein
VTPMDLVLVALLGAFFLLTWGFVGLCGKV